VVEVATTTDPVRLGYLRSALADEGIESFAFDAGAGALWPGAFPNRLMVEDKDAWRAKIVIERAEAEVGD
jgi:hypothetical protein